MSTTKEELKQFWIDCMERRKEHLKMHIASVGIICDKMPVPKKGVIALDEEQVREFDRVEAIKSRQMAWINESRKKLDHAMDMVRLFL